jgi:hypothetical protein
MMMMMNLPHVEASVGNDLLQLSDTLDAWWTFPSLETGDSTLHSSSNFPEWHLIYSFVIISQMVKVKVSLIHLKQAQGGV